ncbi:MAG TPA: bifunctional phosphopantothenoylcysteine decarboxylase/phosphopantothenate--cysteine ligase CoaBC [Atribacteraceae bacterium]|nr:bifunctional phosphopantothenoylcysteine decarboxylase/phosphopantothenate--cysteine ligase CoaBC [Atribacteraceae bacterium]
MIYHPRDFWKRKTILYGVSGGIAAYKACGIVSHLVQSGAQVQVVMTRNARQLVGKATFEALTGKPVITETFSGTGNIHHINLVRESDWIVVAPATANILGKMASGIGDDLLSTLLLVYPQKVILAPAMNSGMWNNPMVQKNVVLLERSGVGIIQPVSGWLACREEGPGRLPDLEPFIEELYYRIKTPKRLTGKKVLVTAGPTREWWDPVRYISNPSSGKMGGALSSAARAEGAQVRMICGAVSERMPSGIPVYTVETARDMEREAAIHFKWCDICFMTAAVSDFRPIEYVSHKLKKNAGQGAFLEFVLNPDILGGLGENKENRILVGFCAESDDLLSEARCKLHRKKADLVVANLIGRDGSGFGVPTVKGWIVDREGRETPFPLIDKTDLATLIIDHISSHFSETLTPPQ